MTFKPDSDKILSVVLLVVVLVSVASCSYNKVNMNKFEEITPEEFCEAYYNEFEVEVEPYENNYETRILADSLESSIVYHQYFDEDEDLNTIKLVMKNNMIY